MADQDPPAPRERRTEGLGGKQGHGTDAARPRHNRCQMGKGWERWVLGAGGWRCPGDKRPPVRNTAALVPYAGFGWRPL